MTRREFLQMSACVAIAVAPSVLGLSLPDEALKTEGNRIFLPDVRSNISPTPTGEQPKKDIEELASRPLPAGVILGSTDNYCIITDFEKTGLEQRVRVPDVKMAFEPQFVYIGKGRNEKMGIFNRYAFLVNNASQRLLLYLMDPKGEVVKVALPNVWEATMHHMENDQLMVIGGKKKGGLITYIFGPYGQLLSSEETAIDNTRAFTRSPDLIETKTVNDNIISRILVSKNDTCVVTLTHNKQTGVISPNATVERIPIANVMHTGCSKQSGYGYAMTMTGITRFFVSEGSAQKLANNTVTYAEILRSANLTNRDADDYVQSNTKFSVHTSVIPLATEKERGYVEKERGYVIMDDIVYLVLAGPGLTNSKLIAQTRFAYITDPWGKIISERPIETIILNQTPRADIMDPTYTEIPPTRTQAIIDSLLSD